METSAATGECVEEAFLKTAEIILQKSEEGQYAVFVGIDDYLTHNGAGWTSIQAARS